MTRLASCALALATLAPLALADDATYDLRALAKRGPITGERVRISVEEHGTTERSGRRQETSTARTYIEQLVSFGPDGEPASARRTYQYFKDAAGTELDVTGVVVLMTRPEGPQGQQTFAPAEGSKPLPGALQEELRREADEADKRRRKGITEAALHEVMLPAEPQPVSGAWKVDMARAAPLLGLEPDEVDVAASTGEGTILGVDERLEGRTEVVWLTVEVKMTVVLKRLQGQPLPTPAPMDLTLTFELPTSDSMERVMTTRQHLDLSPAPAPGAGARVLVDNVRVERREKVR